MWNHMMPNGSIIKQFRGGKTAKEKQTGAHANNRANKEARANWHNQIYNGSRGGSPESFPSHTCNGKKWQAIRGNR